MSETPELKPCPFCGGSRAQSQYIQDGRQTFCLQCGGTAGPQYHGPKDDLTRRCADAWNTRTDKRADDATALLRLAIRAADLCSASLRGLEIAVGEEIEPADRADLNALWCELEAARDFLNEVR